MTKKENIRRHLEAIASLYGVRVKIVEKEFHFRGWADYRNHTVYVNLTGKYATDISTIFHEIGHVHCYREGLWKSYHYSKNRLKRADIIKVRQTGYKSECWIESWAEREMRDLYPEYKYERFYGSEYSRKWFKNWLNVVYPI